MTFKQPTSTPRIRRPQTSHVMCVCTHAHKARRKQNGRDWDLGALPLALVPEDLNLFHLHKDGLQLSFAIQISLWRETATEDWHVARLSYAFHKSEDIDPSGYGRKSDNSKQLTTFAILFWTQDYRPVTILEVHIVSVNTTCTPSPDSHPPPCNLKGHSLKSSMKVKVTRLSFHHFYSKTRISYLLLFHFFGCGHFSFL